MGRSPQGGFRQSTALFPIEAIERPLTPILLRTVLDRLIAISKGRWQVSGSGRLYDRTERLKRLLQTPDRSEPPTTDQMR